MSNDSTKLLTEEVKNTHSPVKKNKWTAGNSYSEKNVYKSVKADRSNRTVQTAASAHGVLTEILAQNQFKLQPYLYLLY